MVKIADCSIPNLKDGSNDKKSTLFDGTPSTSSSDSSSLPDKKKRPGTIWRWFGTRSANDVRPVSLIGYLRFATPFQQFLAILGICMGILSGILQPMWYIICGKMANVLIWHKDDYHSDKIWDELLPIMILNVGIGVTVVFATFIMFFCLRYVSINVIDTIRIQYTKSLLRQDCAWLDRQRFGALSAQLTENIEYITQGSGDKIGNLIRCTAMLISTIVMAFASNWRVAMILVPCTPPIIAFMLLMAKKMNDYAKKALDCAEVTAGVLQEAVMNVRTVQSCNGQATMLRRLTACLTAERVPGVWHYVWEGIGYGLLFFFNYIVFASVVWFGAHQLLDDNSSTPGEILAVVTSVAFTAYLVGSLIPQSSFVLRGQIAAGVLRNIIDLQPTIDCTSEVGFTIDQPTGRIAFNDVSFSYPTRPNKPVLTGLSWTAEPGESVALVGHSGSGKSTSVSLLTRLYNYSSGRVEVDGVDVRVLNIRSLRRMIGIVQQEPALFFGTIFENVALGDPTITPEHVEAVCRLANAHDFIMQFQDGYNTRIGAGSVQLSGGQKQRIAIARALINDPPILLLDEATSALDAESEILVQQALESASRGRTTIIIAHRLSTLRNADKIVVIDQGRVVESGTHSQLITRVEGFYSQLAKAQNFNATTNSQPCSRTNTDGEPVSVAFGDRAHGAGTQKRLSIDEIRGCVQSRGGSLMSLQSSLYNDNPQNPVYSHIMRKGVSFFGSGIPRFYRNCGENYGKLAFSILLSAMRGLDTPVYLLLFLYLYNALENISDNRADGNHCDAFMSSVMWNVRAYVAFAFYLGPVICGACSMSGWTTLRVVDRNKMRAVTNVLHQDASFFDGQQTGNAKVIQRVLTDSVGSRAALDTRSYMVWSHVTALVVLLTAILINNSKIGLLSLAMCVTEIALISFCGYRIQAGFRNYGRKDESAKLSVEIMENVRTMQLLLREKYFLDKYSSKLDRNRPRRIRVSKLTNCMTLASEALSFAITRSFVYFSFFMSFYVGLQLLRSGSYTGGTVFTITQMLGYCTEVIMTISAYMTDVFKSGASADSVLDLVLAPNPHLEKERRDELSRAALKNNLAEVKGTVELKRVRFAYPTRPEVFVANDLSVRADCGQTIALVGPSGSGKSTIVTLLQRYYEPLAGSVKVDGVDVNKYPLKFLRSQMAVVGQEPVLFNFSILDNIRLGVEDEVTMDDIREACRIANALSFIESMPLGYDTPVGEKGAQLSGGQKQRIAIARAIVRRPKILLLDEATSALDANSEKAVQKALNDASAGRTCITIAHRLSSIQTADQIFVIKRGQVVESGTHAELMHKRSAYYELVKKQELEEA